MIEIASIIAGIGFLLSGKKKEETSNQEEVKENAVNNELQNELEELKNQVKDLTEEKKSEEAAEDPRNGKMYFGKNMDGGVYDPFYDLSNDRDGWDIQEAIDGIRMAREKWGLTYRTRILRPMLTTKRMELGKSYTNFGFTAKKINVDGWKDPIYALPMLRGTYTELRFALEVFNPMSYDVPLQKIRLAGLSVGGEQVYPITMLHDGSFLNTSGQGFWWRNLGASLMGLPHYWSNYLLRCNIDATKSESKDARLYEKYKAEFAPSDFEIETIADSFKTQSAMEDYTGFAKRYGVITDAERTSAYEAAVSEASVMKIRKVYEEKLAALQSKKNTMSLGHELPQFREVCQMLNAPVDSNMTSAKMEAIDFTEGLRTPLSNCTKFVTIPAKSSVVIDICIPVVKKPKVYYCGTGYIYDSKDGTGDYKMGNMKISRNVAENWDDTNAMESGIAWPMSTIDGLSKDDLKYIEKRYGIKDVGGYLFFDLEDVGDTSEKTVRMKVACFSDRNNSIHQYKEGFPTKFENGRWLDVGIYQGARPSGRYDWEKTYWDGMEQYSDWSTAIKNTNLWPDGYHPDFIWNFCY